MVKLAKWVQNPEELRTPSPVIDMRVKALGLSTDTLKKVQSGSLSPLIYLKMAAVRIATMRGFTTIDDVREFARVNKIAGVHKGTWGSVFKSEGWVVSGYQASTLPSNHGRKISVWVRASGRIKK